MQDPIKPTKWHYPNLGEVFAQTVKKDATVQPDVAKWFNFLSSIVTRERIHYQAGRVDVVAPLGWNRWHMGRN